MLQLGLDIGGTKNEGVVLDAQDDTVLCWRIPTSLATAVKITVSSVLFQGLGLLSNTQIVKAKFGDSSGVRGAAWLPSMHAEVA